MDPLTIVMLAVLALLIFFMIRNSRKRRADLAELQDKMVPGAEVMTNFGLFGTLLEIERRARVAGAGETRSSRSIRSASFHFLMDVFYCTGRIWITPAGRS